MKHPVRPFVVSYFPWGQPCEIAGNWLALGLLLAAWNASDNEASPDACPRPASLRHHVCVSVRAAQYGRNVHESVNEM